MHKQETIMHEQEERRPDLLQTLVVKENGESCGGDQALQAGVPVRSR